MKLPRIDPRLLSDRRHPATAGGHHYLLHSNTAVSWLIIVPEPEVRELHDLDTEAYIELMLQVRAAGRFMKRHFAADKINTAAIGNIVSRLHAHAVARHEGDCCWPRVVWGNLERHARYTDAQIATIGAALIHALAGDSGTQA